MEFYYDSTYRDVLVIKADGGLNAHTAQEFVSNLEDLIAAGLSKIVVDCTALSYISSYGLGVLIRLHGKLAKRGGDVKICGVKSTVLGVLQLTKLDQVFGIYPDVSRALLEFRPLTQPEPQMK